MDGSVRYYDKQLCRMNNTSFLNHEDILTQMSPLRHLCKYRNTELRFHSVWYYKYTYRSTAIFNEKLLQEQT